MSKHLNLIALPGIPLVRPGDDLIDLIFLGLSNANEQLVDGDILVIAQKIVSKSEDQYVELKTINPSKEALHLAKQTEKDPRLVELILSESREVIRHRTGVIIVEHKLGFVMANAGIDNSNVENSSRCERVLLLPINPDETCTKICLGIKKKSNKQVAVIINDSVGRAWRVGTVGIALGVAGLESVLDLRGNMDLYGRPLLVSIVGLGDELSAAASIIQGQGDEGLPIVLIRGLNYNCLKSNGSTLVRNKEEDLFR